MYASRQTSGKITSTMVLFLPSGGVQTDMPHHLIGPGGAISIGTGGDLSTAIAGDLRFIKMG